MTIPLMKSITTTVNQQQQRPEREREPFQPNFHETGLTIQTLDETMKHSIRLLVLFGLTAIATITIVNAFTIERINDDNEVTLAINRTKSLTKTLTLTGLMGAGSSTGNRGIIDVIDHIINLGQSTKCATGQGQPGHCTLGSCNNLGNYTAVGCPGRNRFIKCCPTDQAIERLPPEVPECGVRPVLPGDLIVGGDEARPYSWPWATALYRIRDSRRFFQCGATIINARYILTAAHCVHRPNENVRPSDYRVQVGAHDLTKSGQFMEIEDILVHENYTPQYHNDDIALLRLKDRLDFGKNRRIAPVCLPPSGSRLGRTAGTMATMIGWGVHDQMDFQPSDTLFQVRVPTVDLDRCSRTYSSILSSNYYFDWDNVICAGEKEGGKDTCQGDSGGPMLIPEQQNGRYYQIGVVSFGYGCAEKGYPGVYTYVPHYLRWIGAHMY